MENFNLENFTKVLKNMQEEITKKEIKLSFQPAYKLIPLPKELITKDFIEPKVLVCSICKHPVSNGVSLYYSCSNCSILTTNVEWIKKIII